MNNASIKSIVSVILVVAAVGVGYFGVLPRWSAYTSAKQVLDLNNQQKTKLENAQSTLNSFLDEYNQHTTQAATLNQALPLTQSQMYNVLNSLDSLARQSGLSLGTISVLDKPENDSLGAAPNSIQPVDLSFTISGTYSSCKNFIAKLESNLRIIDVTSMSIQGGQDSNTLDFILNIRTYYQR